MRPLSKLIAITLLSAAAACGASDPAPKPLSKRFDDMFIARVPIDQQRAAVEAPQSAFQVAKMENATADANTQEAKSALTIVRNEHKASKLAVDSAKSNKKNAESTHDTNRINQAARELNAAELAEKAAAARVKYFEAYVRYTNKASRLTQENMYWRESQFELSKSKLAQKNNIAPKDVQYEWFPTQEAERGKRVVTAKQKADEEKKKALAARDNWLKLQAASDKENGRDSAQLSDPMAPKRAPVEPSIAPAEPAPSERAE
jgi:hypothetical protein